MKKTSSGGTVWNRSGPKPPYRDLQNALPLARKAAESAPHIGDAWTILALVELRSGRPADPLAALKKAQPSPGGGTGVDFARLTMAHATLGEWQAVAWNAGGVSFTSRRGGDTMPMTSD